MGKVKDRRSIKQHRLLVYQRIGNRMRSAPFLIGGLSLILFALGWMSTQDFMQGVDTGLLRIIWRNNVYLIIILFVCGVIFVYGMAIGALSYVEARARSLHIQAGLMAINISYRRIKQIRLSQVGVQYPADTLRGSDADLLDPLLGLPCTVVDLRSWPWPGFDWLKRLWSRFMFSSSGTALMLVVTDAMVLNQQIDGRVAVLQAQSKQSQYLDPLERAVQQQKKSGRR